jgi:ribose 5-phosphate isomerase B
MESENIEKENSGYRREEMRIGIAADHGGFELKVQLIAALTFAGYLVKDFGATELDPDDDYPDFVIPLARAVSKGEITRGLAICGSGVGAGIAANKVPGARAALISDSFSAHQGVEDDNMNMMCLGGRVTGSAQAWELVLTFLNADFSTEERFRRRLDKVSALEKAKD